MASVLAGMDLSSLLRELARLVAQEIRDEVKQELARLVGVQALGDEWTCSVSEAAQLLGVDRNRAYDEIRRTGSLYGARVLRVGNRYRVSKLSLLALLTENGSGAASTGPGRKEAIP